MRYDVVDCWYRHRWSSGAWIYWWVTCAWSSANERLLQWWRGDAADACKWMASHRSVYPSLPFLPESSRSVFRPWVV